MAMGWGVLDLAGHRFVIASGAAPGTQTRLTLLPEKNKAVAILCNASSPDEFALWRIEWETFCRHDPRIPGNPGDSGAEAGGLRLRPRNSWEIGRARCRPTREARP